MIRLVVRVSMAAALAATMMLGVGCAKKVTVQDGTVVMCTAGHVISDDTKEIEVKVSDVAQYGVKTVTETCPTHKAIEAALSEARKAIASGDLTAARAKLEQILQDDPANAEAKRLLADAGGSADASSGGKADPGEGEAEEPETPTGPIMSLAVFVPDELAGFSAQALVADVFTLTRMYVPAGGPTASVVIVAEQFKDAKAAKAALDKQIKSAYPEGGATVTVDGTSAYFGGNQGVGAIAFTSDAVLVVIEGAAESGKASDVKSALTDIAKQIVR